MILRNRVFRVRNFEYGQQRGRLATSQKSCFQAAKCSNMSSAILQEDRFADVQESRFQASKRWDMGSAKLHDCRFADAQKSRFQAVKRSNMGSAVQQWGRLATSQKSRFQAAKRSVWAVPSSKKIDLLMLRNRVFMLRNVQIWVMDSF